MLDIHTTDRIVIDQNTMEIVLCIGRVETGGTVSPCDTSILIKKRSCRNNVKHEVTIKAYDVHDGNAYFTLPDEFKTAQFPAGMYDVDVIVDCCVIDRLELLKPRLFVSCSYTNSEGCGENKWQEPDCLPEKKKKKSCSVKKCECEDEKVSTAGLNLGERL